MPDDSTRTPFTICWHCDQPLDAASELQPEGHRPTPGAISLCLYCGAVAVFGPELLLYPPTKEELEELAEDREFMQSYMSFAWARQYLMIQHKLLHDEGPDR